MIGTAVFVLIILATTDKRRDGTGIPAPIAIGLALTLVHFALIGFTGTSVNPARSIGPGLFAGWDVLQQQWVFILAPLAGAAVAGLGYPAIFGWDRERPVRAPRPVATGAPQPGTRSSSSGPAARPTKPGSAAAGSSRRASRTPTPSSSGRAGSPTRAGSNHNNGPNNSRSSHPSPSSSRSSPSSSLGSSPTPMHRGSLGKRKAKTVVPRFVRRRGRPDALHPLVNDTSSTRSTPPATSCSRTSPTPSTYTLRSTRSGSSGEVSSICSASR